MYHIVDTEFPDPYDYCLNWSTNGSSQMLKPIFRAVPLMVYLTIRFFSKLSKLALLAFFVKLQIEINWK